jgi:hypothetical protein
MLSSSDTAPQNAPELLPQGLTLAAGETRDYEIDGRVVTVHGTDTEVAVLSSQGKAVVIRRQPGDRYLVTGASAHHHASEPLAREDAISLAVRRLER